MHIAVCVCTFGRPQMLKRCLAAIKRVHTPTACRVSIIVIDNEAEPNNAPIATAVDGVHYVHEPRKGIANARNAALEKALEVNADFIAMTDDDAEPSVMWLEALLLAQRKCSADVVRGKTVFNYPDPLPKWIIKPTRVRNTGPVFARPENPLYISTNNVLFSARLVREIGFNLRFDARFNATGGEDTDFFTRAFERGARIVASDAPIVFEEMLPDRCTFWRQVRRQYQYATGNTITDLDRRRYLGVVTSGIGRFAKGLFWASAAAIAMPFSGRHFRKYALRAGGKVMYAAGQFSTLAGFHYKGYQTVDGY